MKKSKKFLSAFIATAALLVGGSLVNKTTVKAAKTPIVKKVKKTPTKKNSLVLYFSLTNTTKGAADQIHKITGAKEIRLQPKVAYGDYDSAARRGDNERRNNIHPELRTKLPSLKKYNTIYLGFPTWWQRPPMLISTLFDTYSFKGKTIVPFTTSMETPMSASMPYVQKMAKKDKAKEVVNGYRYNGNNKGLRNWLKRANLIKK